MNDKNRELQKEIRESLEPHRKGLKTIIDMRSRITKLSDRIENQLSNTRKIDLDKLMTQLKIPSQNIHIASSSTANDKPANNDTQTDKSTCIAKPKKSMGKKITDVINSGFISENKQAGPGYNTRSRMRITTLSRISLEKTIIDHNIDDNQDLPRFTLKKPTTKTNSAGASTRASTDICNRGAPVKYYSCSLKFIYGSGIELNIGDCFSLRNFSMESNQCYFQPNDFILPNATGMVFKMVKWSVGFNPYIPIQKYKIYGEIFFNRSILDNSYIMDKFGFDRDLCEKWIDAVEKNIYRSGRNWLYRTDINNCFMEVMCRNKNMFDRHGQIVQKNKMVNDGGRFYANILDKMRIKDPRFFEFKFFTGGADSSISIEDMTKIIEKLCPRKNISRIENLGEPHYHNFQIYDKFRFSDITLKPKECFWISSFIPKSSKTYGYIFETKNIRICGNLYILTGDILVTKEIKNKIEAFGSDRCNLKIGPLKRGLYETQYKNFTIRCGMTKGEAKSMEMMRY